jgi:hypothetical protein
MSHVALSGAPDWGEKPYALLFEALRRSAYFGLAQWTLVGHSELPDLGGSYRMVALAVSSASAACAAVPETGPEGVVARIADRRLTADGSDGGAQTRSPASRTKLLRGLPPVAGRTAKDSRALRRFCCGSFP